MVSESADLLRCKQLIEQKLDWGPGDTWVSADFDQLQQRIIDETGVSLSVSTLRRIWGRVDYGHMPSTTTLNTLAQFAGFSDWRHLVRTQESATEPPVPVGPILVKPAKQVSSWPRVSWIWGAVLLLTLLGIVAINQNHRQLNTATYRFSSQPLTRSIPNSVIFTYDVSASPTDLVSIQQSWDPSRRERVSRNGHVHTSVYYEPGFYRAKLVVGQQVVREHPLLIPTQGWMGMIATKPVPVYLKPAEFIDQQGMHLPSATIRAKNIPLQPEAPLVKYFNVGNFKPVPVMDFAFSCQLKNEYSEGSAACQRTWVELLTDDMPITIPLSTKGCVSELMLVDGTRSVLGKTTDLSGLGVDFTNWVTVTCHSDGRKLYYQVNGKLAYSAPLPAKPLTIIGIVYGFRGTGAVKAVRLRTRKGLVFKTF